jgi:hypothetical protein
VDGSTGGGVIIAPWPLTGRTSQLEELGQAYRTGGSGGVMLHGPAGAGKTRLAEEALALAERSGRPVARAVGHPSTAPIPLGALAHLLPASLVGGLGVGEEERTALFHAARAELRRMAGDGRLVLLVDDLDLLDDTSVAVLVPLVVSRTIFLIGTVRTGRSPSPRLTGLQRDGHLGRLELAPLTADELGALLHRALDHPVAAGALDELVRLSGGNLQVLIELVRGAVERQVLVRDGDAWHLVGELPTTVALDELVGEHLAGVDPAGLAVLELLAVCERLGLADLERRHGLATLEALEAGRLVAVVAAGRRTAVRLAHPLYGEVLRARMPPLRLRRIQQELADVVEGHGARRREDVVQVALWRSASGGHVPGEQLLRAARLALAGHDADLAVRLMSAWAEPDDAHRFERAEVLAGAYDVLGRPADVERVIASGACSAGASPAPGSRRGGTSPGPSTRSMPPARSCATRVSRSPSTPAGPPCSPTPDARSRPSPCSTPSRHRTTCARAWSSRRPAPSACSAWVATSRRPSSRGAPPPTTPRCPAGSPGAASPPTSSTRPTPSPTAGATPRRVGSSSRPPSRPGPPTPWGRGCGSRWCSPRSPGTPGGAGRRSGGSRRQRPRPARPGRTRR